jgi:hypothetical protein
MPVDVASLIKSAHASQDCFERSLEWLEKTGRESKPLKSKLRRAVFVCADIIQAAALQPSLGVYGASQAGKSYLLAHLASIDDDPLEVKVGEIELDFLKQLNGEGGHETTGLVTRFTIGSNSPKSPDTINFPVRVRLLSEADLITIFANSYVYDFKHEEQDEEGERARVKQIVDLFKSLEHQADGSGKDASAFRKHFVYKLEKYYNSHLKRLHPDSRAIEQSGFWDRASELMPKLRREDRANVAKILWANNQEFSKLFDQLAKQIELIGNPDEVWCETEVLVERLADGSGYTRSAASILHVQALKDLFEIGGGKEIRILAGELTHKLPCSALAALTAEVVLTLKRKPNKIFNSMDLLDFPGARARGESNKATSGQSAWPTVISNFRRGKVSFLFDRYISNYEIPGLMLCVGPSNLEANSVANELDEWVKKTHGKDPENRRASKLNSLFFVLTKFDLQFSENKGDSVSQVRWETRLKASLIEPFANRNPTSDWVNNWFPGKPFDNLYWFRNPNADNSQLIYSIDGKEIKIRDEKKSLVENLKEHFLETPYVKQHFKDPSRAWDEAWRLNDGGKAYLYENLNSAFDDKAQILKLKQLTRALEEQVNDIIMELDSHYIPDDPNEAHEKKTKTADAVKENLISLAENDRLGEFIQALLFSDDTISTLLTKTKSALSHSTQQAKGSFRDRFLKTNERYESTPVHDDFAREFIEKMLAQWKLDVSEMFKGSKGDYLQRSSGSKKEVYELLEEFTIAVDRELREQLTKQIQDSYIFSQEDRKTLRLAAEIAAIFNEFISRGGIKADRVELDLPHGKKEKIIKPQAMPLNSSISIGPAEIYVGDQLFINWINAVQSMVMANTFVSKKFGTAAETENNRFLGEILKTLSHINQEIGAQNL